MHKPKPFWFLRRRQIESEVDEELQLHLEMRTAQLRAEGLDPEDADGRPSASSETSMPRAAIAGSRMTRGRT